MSFNWTVKVFPLAAPSGKMVAMASLIIDDEVEVSGFKIFNGTNGVFAAAPSKPGKPDAEGKTKYYDDVRFLGDRDETTKRTALQSEILQAMADAYQTPGNARADAAKAQGGQTAGEYKKALAAGKDASSKDTAPKGKKPVGETPLWE